MRGLGGKPDRAAVEADLLDPRAPWQGCARRGLGERQPVRTRQRRGDPVSMRLAVAQRLRPQQRAQQSPQRRAVRLRPAGLHGKAFLGCPGQMEEVPISARPLPCRRATSPHGAPAQNPATVRNASASTTCSGGTTIRASVLMCCLLPWRGRPPLRSPPAVSPAPWTGGAANDRPAAHPGAGP